MIDPDGCWLKVVATLQNDPAHAVAYARVQAQRFLVLKARTSWCMEMWPTRNMKRLSLTADTEAPGPAARPAVPSTPPSAPGAAPPPSVSAAMCLSIGSAMVKGAGCSTYSAATASAAAEYLDASMCSKAYNFKSYNRLPGSQTVI